MTAAEALIACAVIVLLICLMCAVPVFAALHNAKMDVDRDREER